MATGINFCTDGSLKEGAGGGQARGGAQLHATKLLLTPMEMQPNAPGQSWGCSSGAAMHGGTMGLSVGKH